jgi:Ca-activated chloride channel family protein
MINIQGEELKERQPQNLVFLLDVSGSMYSYNKLPLVKRSMELLLDKLSYKDTISIVTYSSGTKVLASGINASRKGKIMSIINSLGAGGSTAGEAGLQRAYEQAEKFKCDGNNRIILCTDGDFNVGISDNDELKKMISEKRDNNIFISVLGFGMGNYKDDKLETIADNGDGGYYYIDNLREAKKVLSDEMTSTLYTIAKDVKIQVEFNPSQVESYRLIGYENRVLENEQFADDKTDAGELGAGASVTALYEIVPAKTAATEASSQSELRYQTAIYRDSNELMDVKLRYKLPTGGDSILKEYPITAEATTAEPGENFRFAAGVAELGMLLNDSEYKGTSSYDSVIELIRGAMGDDKYGFRHELVQMVDLIRFLNR